MDQWKAKREAVGENATCVQTQTAAINLSHDETTQTDQHNSDAQAINIPTVSTKKRGAIDTDKVYIYWWATKTSKIRPSRLPCSGIADKYFFFLLGLRPLHISCVGVGGLSPISLSGVCYGKRPMSAGSSGSIKKKNLSQ
jgi:hypothetical protein